MKNLLLGALLMLLGAVSIQAQHITSEPPCKSSFWDRTYGPMARFADPPARTHLEHRCVVVTGKVYRIYPPDQDGDYKMLLTVDLQRIRDYERFGVHLLNFFNFTGGRDGRLVVEVVCAYPVTDPDRRNGAYIVCPGYTNRVYKPRREGERVSVIGELVTDTGPSRANPVQDHGWKEIHPVTSITPIP